MIGSETGAEGEGKAAGRERQKGQEAERSAAAAAAIYCTALLRDATAATTALRHWFVWWFVAGLRRRRRFSVVASSKQAGTCPDQSNLPQQASKQAVPWSQWQLHLQSQEMQYLNIGRCKKCTV